MTKYIYWTPPQGEQHDEDYARAFQEWTGHYENTQILAVERRRVREIMELKQEQAGNEFVGVRATPRYIKHMLEQAGLPFTRANALDLINAIGTLSNFDQDRIYDIDRDTIDCDSVDHGSQGAEEGEEWKS